MLDKVQLDTPGLRIKCNKTGQLGTLHHVPNNSWILHFEKGDGTRTRHIIVFDDRMLCNHQDDCLEELTDG